MGYICASAKSSADNPTQVTNFSVSTTRPNSTTVRVTASFNFSISPETQGNFTHYLIIEYGGVYYGSSSALFSRGWWAGTLPSFTASASVDIPVGNTSSGSGIMKFYISNSSSSVPTAYGLNTTPMIWNGKDASGGNQLMSKTVSWEEYVPPITGPSLSSISVSPNQSYYPIGQNVTLSWTGYKGTGNITGYTLTKNGTTLQSGNSTSYSDTITQDSTYRVTVYDSNGYSDYSSKTLRVVSTNGQPQITGLGEEGFLSLPGYIKNNSLKITWSAAAAGNGNRVTGYEVWLDDVKQNSAVIAGTSATLTLNNLVNNKPYKVVVKAIGQYGDSTESAPQTFYYVAPVFSSEPVLSKNFLTNDSITISWPVLTVPSGLDVSYDVYYGIVPIEGTPSYTKINDNPITSNSQEWIPNNVADNSIIKFKIIATVKKGGNVFTTAEQTSSRSYFKGTPPTSFDRFEFKVPTDKIYGDVNPLQAATVGGNITFNGTYNNYLDAIEIICHFPNNFTPSDIYFHRAIVQWSKGGFSGELISFGEVNDGKISITLNTTNASNLFADNSNQKIHFTIYSAFETKNNENPSGIYIYEDTPSLDKDANFVKAQRPQMYTNGTTIPSLNSNAMRNVDFVDREVTSVNNTDIHDYEFNDLRVNKLIGSSAKIVGYRVYAIVGNDAAELRAGIYQGGNAIAHSGNSGYFPLSDSVDSNSVVDDNNRIDFRANILSDSAELKTLLNGGESLETIATIKTLRYEIRAVDALKQESIDNISFEATYDFRIAAKLLDSVVFDSGVVNEFYDESNNAKDYVIFDWYPAFHANQYLKSSELYHQEGEGNAAKYYLKNAENDECKYTVYKWIDENTSYSTALIKGVDYTVLSEVKGGQPIVKYRAKFPLKLQSPNNREIFTLTLVPHYVSEGIMKTETPKKNLNPIKASSEDNTGKLLTLKPFNPPSVSWIGCDRENGNFTITVKLNETDTTGLTSKAKIENSSLDTAGHGLEVNGIISNPNYTYNFGTYASGTGQKIYDNMPFTATITTTRSITRKQVDNFNYLGVITDTVFSTLTRYISAVFATMSLRKNKVGVNISDMAEVEEALYVVAKDRVDSTASLDPFGGSQYPHVMSLQGNTQTRMPKYDLVTGKAVTGEASTTPSVYIGFYGVDDNNKPYRVGSFGIENGEPYFVFKGKYFADQNPSEDNTGVQKRFNNKDYFEKISFSSLAHTAPPVGTIATYPKARITVIQNNETTISQEKLQEYNPTWLLCDGRQVSYSEYPNLAKALYGDNLDLDENGIVRNGSNQIIGFLLPNIKPYITDPSNMDCSDKYCYIIKGDA